MDDAALSLGSALLAGSLGNEPVIVNVFSRSNYTIHNRGTGNVETVTEKRKTEETSACRIMRAKARFLDFDEAFVRGAAPVTDLLKKDYEPVRDPVYPRITEAVEGLLRTVAPSVAVFPLAVRGHVDHRILSSIGRDFLRRRAAAVAFFEDMPYAGVMGDRQLKRAARRVDRRLACCLLAGVECERKIDLLRTYESQIREQDLEIVRRHHKLRTAERLWTTEPVAEMLRSTAEARD
jgi:hypothetical protein